MADDKGRALPDYFELLRNMMGAASPAHSNAAANMQIAGMAALDPDEIDKKIRELEVVQMWLQAQANAVDLSIKGMQYQRDMLRQFGAARDQAANVSKEDLAKFANAFNPTNWLSQMMPAPDQTVAGQTTAAKKSPPRKKRS